MPHITDHAHPMHKGPHHDMYIHESNKHPGGVKHTTTMEKLEGHLKSEDVAGHKGEMKSKEKGCSY